MSRSFDPSDWYYTIDADTLYSTKALRTVPADDADYAAWREAGGEPNPLPYDATGTRTLAALDAVLVHYGLIAAPTAVPDRCTKLGLKRALAETGPDAVFPQPEWPAVKAAIASDADLQEDWDLAIEIRRADPLVEAMIAARKYDDATVGKILVRAVALAG